MCIYTYHGSLEYSKSLPLVEKTMRATSASQSTEISCAFLSKPDLLFENVTCLLILFSILFNSTLPLPIYTLSNINSQYISSPLTQILPTHAHGFNPRMLYPLSLLFDFLLRSAAVAEERKKKKRKEEY